MERRTFLKSAAAGAAGLSLAACGESSAQEASAECPDASAGGPGGGACDALTRLPSAVPTIRAAGDGDRVEGSEVVLKVRAREMGNYWSMMESELPPKTLVMPHTHDDYDQAIFIIKGEVQMRFGGSDGEVITAPQGSYGVKPKGIPHAFWNPSETETVIYIELSANKTFEDFVLAAEGVTDFVEINTIARAHSTAFHYEMVPQIVRDYGIRKIKGSAIELPYFDENGELTVDGPPMPPSR